MGGQAPALLHHIMIALGHGAYRADEQDEHSAAVVKLHNSNPEGSA
jgi:hypothetical protein